MSSSPNNTNNAPEQPAQQEVGVIGGMWNSLKEGTTPGVKNIEAAYSRAGGSKTHTPGSATKLGSQDNRQPHSSGTGLGGETFANSISDQRPEPTYVEKVFDNLLNGSNHMAGNHQPGTIKGDIGQK